MKIETIWKKYKSTANLVGSMKTGLLMNHLDIDYHIYSEDFSINTSFSAIAEIAQNSRVKQIYFKNNLEEEDRCLEWHLEYIDEKVRMWQIDLIHIVKDSPYAGKFERVAEKINLVLTEELRSRILRIKWELSESNIKAMGVEVCKAVIDDNVSTYSEFLKWKENNSKEGILIWEPQI